MIADEDDDDYSDSFDEINITQETGLKQKSNEIEDLLKTATEDQLNILK